MKYKDNVSKPPENGCVVKGLYLEGAGWNNDESILEEAQPKVLFVEMPPIHFLPELEKEVTLDKPIQTAKKPEED